MSSPSIPQPFATDVTTHFANAFDAGLDEIHIKEIAGLDKISFTSKMGGLDGPPIETKSTLTTTSRMGGLKDEPLVLKIGITELPKVDVGIQFAMKPTRVHFPLHFRFGICAMGMELVALSICGESMMVVEDYVPHKAEKCG